MNTYFDHFVYIVLALLLLSGCATQSDDTSTSYLGEKATIKSACEFNGGVSRCNRTCLSGADNSDVRCMGSPVILKSKKSK